MKRVLLIITSLFFILSAFPGLLSAQRMGRGMMGEGRMMGRGMGRGHGRNGKMCFGDRKHMRENLNMTDRQISIISKINEKFRDRLIIFRDKIRPKKKQLRALLLSREMDFPRIKNLLKEIADIEVEIRMIKIMQRNEIEKIFTPAQHEKMRNERMQNRGR